MDHSRRRWRSNSKPPNFFDRLTGGRIYLTNLCGKSQLGESPYQLSTCDKNGKLQ